MILLYAFIVNICSFAFMEIKQITEFPRYLIHENGQVYSNHSNKFLKPQLVGSRKRKYLAVFLMRQGDSKVYAKFVHRLVATEFIPNPENKPTVNHKDNDILNNWADNLEWATYQEQEDHKYKTSGGVTMQPKGGKHCKAIKVYQYSKDKKDFIAAHECIADAARILGIPTANTIGIIRCCRGTKYFNSAYGYYWSYTKLETDAVN